VGEQPRKFGGLSVGERLHLQARPSEFGHVGGGGSDGRRDLVGGDRGRDQAGGAAQVSRVDLGVHRDPMADGELGLIPVGHRQQRCLQLVWAADRCRVAAATGVKDRCAVGSGHLKFDLEQPRLVPQPVRLALAVDQEQRDDPVAGIPVGAETPGAALHDDVGLLRVGRLRGELAVGQREPQAAAAR
jgi:hypothetical protein